MADKTNILLRFTEGEMQFLSRLMRRIGPLWDSWGLGAIGSTFKKWVDSTIEKREVQNRDKERVAVKRILGESQRGSRSQEDKDVLKRFCQKLAVFPKDLSPYQMDVLCNEVDFYPVTGRSVIFLQGDFGNVYYVIAIGEVALYLETSKDREMAIGREFGHQRGLPYKSPLSPDIRKSVNLVMNEELEQRELSKLGFRIFVGKAGFGFGEAAILSTKSKLRGATAFSNTDDTFLLVLHGDTYNTVLRQAHYRQKQLAACTSLLSQLPLFKAYPYAKLSNIAYYMRSQGYSTTALIRAAGSPVDRVLIVNTGSVKQLHPVNKGRLGPEATEEETLTRRLPALAYAILGRGSVIGEIEMHRRLPTFQFTYISGSNDCEVFEMPLEVYIDHVSTRELRGTDLYKSIETIKQAQEQLHGNRLHRAVDAIKAIVVSEAKANDDKANLLKMLPLLVDGLDVDNTMAWDPANQKEGLDFRANPRGFLYEKAAAQHFLKEPEDHPRRAPMSAAPPPSSAAGSTGSARLARAARAPPDKHFQSRLVARDDDADDVRVAKAPGSPRSSVVLRSPRVYHKPASERVKPMGFGKASFSKRPLGQ